MKTTGDSVTTPRRPKILIVDDKAENLFAMERLLDPLDATVIQATSGQEALTLTLDHDICVAIVDVQMPGMDGYELVELWRNNQDTAQLPVIFVSAYYSDDYHHRRGYGSGAVDFLSKPFNPEILISKVEVFINLWQQKQQLQKLVDQLNAANEALAKRAVQLETSNQVGHQVTSILNPDQLLSEVVSLIQARFGYYYVSIWLLESDHITLQAVAGRDSATDFKAGFKLARDAHPSIIAHVICHREPYLSNDVQDDPHYLFALGLPDTRAEFAVPLQHKIAQEGETKLTGVLDIQSDRPHAFDTGDVTVIQLLANQIAVAIRNARLYAEVTHFNEALERQVRKRTEELERAYEQLEALDRNKSDFIQVISHELRTPLTLIKGYSQILIDDPAIIDHDQRYLQVSGIVSGASRMQDMIESMVDVARIDSDTLKLDLRSVRLDVLFLGLAQRLDDALCQRNLELRQEGIGIVPPIEADAGSLSKLFEHLLINAIKYTPDGGSITVAGRTLEMRINRQPVRFVEVTVSDTGIGIPIQLQELIFSKFYQGGKVAYHSSGKTKFKGGGPGLGLTIARGIAKAHGGQVWAESPGYDEETCPGSTFHVVLPITQRDRTTPKRPSGE